MIEVFKGNIIHTIKMSNFDVLDDGYIIVEDGQIISVRKDLPKDYEAMVLRDYTGKLLIPGFVDIHFHGPQFENIGLGYDEELLEWLEKYTFKAEAKYWDMAYSEKAYTLAIEALIRNGTSRGVLFGTVFKESTVLLSQIAEQKGLITFVGKVNMDRNTPDSLLESTEDSIEATQSYLSMVDNGILSPRFVPTCSFELMSALGKMAKEKVLPVQTHLSENQGEIQWVRSLHPEADSYLDVYKRAGLLGEKSIFAHCVYCDEDDFLEISNAGAFIAFCPNANFNLSSGMFPIRRALASGVNVGLGTDVGAGHKMSIKDVMVSAIQMSKMRWILSDKLEAPLTLSEAFYLGTKGGGKFFGNVGSFEAGNAFDMLVIDDSYDPSFKTLSTEERLERFVFTGDDRQIISRFINGKKVNIF